MARTTILADDELLVEAKHIAAQQGRTLTAVVEDALRAYVAAHRKPRLSFVGIGRSGHSDLSARTEELLAEGVSRVEGFPRSGASSTG